MLGREGGIAATLTEWSRACTPTGALESMRGWLEGETASLDRIDDLPGFAVSVAGFIRALQRVGATGGLRAGV